MRISILVLLLSVFLVGIGYSQSSVFVRNSTWQDFDVSISQVGTHTVDPTEWSEGDAVVRGWLETTGQEVLTVNRTNAAVPEGDTVVFDVHLTGNQDALTVKLRIIGVSGGTELDYTVSGDGFSEPWYDDAGFHEVQTTLAGKSVVIKFKPDNDDTNQDRDIRFAIHDLPVYVLDEADFEDPNVMNALIYNVQMISFGVSGMPQASDRAALLPAQLSPYQDVVVYCEVFDDIPREDHLIPAMQAAGFPYRTEILNEPTGIVPFPVNGGVMIFSRWPIESEDEIDYTECGQAAQDCLSSKGVKYARVNKLGKRYHIFGTHMDAGGGADDIFARRTQMAEIRDFIADLQIPENEPVIVGGDFNVDPIGSDNDYAAFLDTLDPVIPLHIGYWESNFNDNFGGIIDHAWGVRTHLVPTELTNDVITIRSLEPVLWDLSEFSDHRAVQARCVYPDMEKSGGDTLICPGESISMSVDTEFPVTYKWMKDGVELQGANASEYNIFNALESQSGNYSCLVSYDVIYGNWTDSVTPLFFPNGPDTVEARLNFDFREVIINQAQCELSVQERDNELLSIYPNPTADVLNFRLRDDVRKAEVLIYTSKGELISSSFFQEKVFSLDMSKVPTGLYLAEVRSEMETVYQRFVVY